MTGFLLTDPVSAGSPTGKHRLNIYLEAKDEPTVNAYELHDKPHAVRSISFKFAAWRQSLWYERHFSKICGPHGKMHAPMSMNK